jgi:hypothetical protein
MRTGRRLGPAPQFRPHLHTRSGHLYRPRHPSVPRLPAATSFIQNDLRDGIRATVGQLSLAPHSSSMLLAAMLETKGLTGESGAEPLKMPLYLPRT